jgi:hypothetical protein
MYILRSHQQIICNICNHLWKGQEMSIYHYELVPKEHWTHDWKKKSVVACSRQVDKNHKNKK